METKLLTALLKSIVFFLFINKIQFLKAFSECNLANNLPAISIPFVNNCLSLLAFYQSQGQDIRTWCQNSDNYQRCCLTCQNYMRLSTCNDIAFESDCILRARLGQCNMILANNQPVRNYCPKSCGACQQNSLTGLSCDNLFIGCNTGSCSSMSYFSVISIGCTCPADRGGTYCNLINPCFSSNPCLNGGVCTPSYSFEASYTCSCPSDCSGKNCETCNRGCNSFTCFNGGYCTLNVFSQPYCICNAYYTGPNCQTLINPCLSNPCQNGGACNQVNTFNAPSYTCSCQLGCSGTNCQFCNQGCNTMTCFNGGYCALNYFNQPYCICPASYTGANCQAFISACSSNPCQNGGSCQNLLNNDYSCSCLSNFYGKNCQFAYTNDVCNRGDLNPTSCASWKALGFCKDTFLFQNIPIPEYCPLSCNRCSYIACNDQQINCGLWANLGYCTFLTVNYPTMCNRSCNTCSIFKKK